MRGVGVFFFLVGTVVLGFTAYRIYDLHSSGVELLNFRQNHDLLVNLGVNIVSALIHLAVGRMTIGASRHFKLIVKTKGRDISHLMDGIGRLRGAYSVLYTVILIAFAALLVGVVLSLFGANLFPVDPLEVIQ
jgi:hypothetical protein